MSAKITKDEILKRVKAVAENEKFKIDAYFFCGYPSGAPNQDLMRACEKYLGAADDAAAKKPAADELVKALEDDMASVSAVADKDNILSSEADVKVIYENRELLFA